MITFESQKAFEEAVLQIIRDNLYIVVNEDRDSYSGDKYTKLYLKLKDETISSDTF